MNCFSIQKELGAGGNGVVFQATDPSGSVIAVKAFKGQGKQAKADREHAASSGLHHPNLGRCLGLSETPVVLTQFGLKEPTPLLYLEYYGGGQLFDMVENGPFSESICRFLFSQVLQGVKHMHSLGLFHFDLKLENIMIDGPLELANVDAWVKVVDFGCVASVIKQKTGFTNYYNQGTECYNAPEIHNHQPYMGEPVDVFALGYVLFAMGMGNAPFGIANKKTDTYYSALAKGEYDQYWACYSGSSAVSEEFKHLITQMFHQNPSERLTLDQVWNHKWMEGPVATCLEVQQELLSRRN